MNKRKARDTKKKTFKEIEKEVQGTFAEIGKEVQDKVKEIHDEEFANEQEEIMAEVEEYNRQIRKEK